MNANLELVGGLLSVDGEGDQSGRSVDVTANQQAGSHAFARLFLCTVSVLQVSRRHDVTVLTAEAETNKYIWSRSTQPCIPPESLNRVPASAGVKAGMSPLPDGR